MRKPRYHVRRRDGDRYFPMVTQLKDKGFLPTTVRYVLYTLSMAAGMAGTAILISVPVFNPILAVILSLGALAGTLYYNYSGDERQSFYWLLAFAGVMGLVLGPSLAAIAATVPNGAFIIFAALVTTVAQTSALLAYTWYKANFTPGQMSTFGSFLSMGLTGLMVLGLINAFFPTSTAILTHAVMGVFIFSGYLVYDFWLVKTGRYSSPVIAAVNIFLDIINLFVDLLRVFILLKTSNDNSSDFSSDILSILAYRLLPLLLIVGAVLSFGYLEDYWTKADERDLRQAANTPPPSPSATHSSAHQQTRLKSEPSNAFVDGKRCVVLLAAVTFKKNVLLKIAITLGSITILLGIASALLIHLCYPNCLTTGLTQLVVPSIKGAHLIFWSILAPFCWYLTYLKLTNIELR